MSEITDQSEAQARHSSMVAQLREMLVENDIRIVKDEYHRETFGLWVITIIRGEQIFDVSWDAFDARLECTAIVEMPSNQRPSSFAEIKFEQGLKPETLHTINSFVVEQTARFLKGDVVSPPPWKGGRPMGTIGWVAIVLGAIAAFRFGLERLLSDLLSLRESPAIGITVIVFAGVVLVLFHRFRK